MRKVRKVRKVYKVAALTLSLSAILSFTAFAGDWKQNDTGWWYVNDDNSYPTGQWVWLDGNNDGVAECYYFNPDGYMAANTTTPDGYTVNSDGAWTIDGVVQTQASPQKTAINNPDVKLQTDFIKQKYVDCLGKNRDYVLNRLGTGFEEETNPKDFSYGDVFGKDGKTAIVVLFDSDTGTAYEIRSYFGWGLFSGGEDGYTFEEFNRFLKTEPHENGSGQTCWLLSEENPTVMLTDASTSTYMSFELFYFKD